MKQTKKDKSVLKRELLLKRTAQALNTDVTTAALLFSTPRLSSFRINRLKVPDETELLAELAVAGWKGQQCDWYPSGYVITEGRTQIVDSEAHKEGLLFIQNQASWLPVLALDPQPEEAILDMCAAPGGKASHIAELTNNQAVLQVNDNSRTRLYKLKANFRRLGAVFNEQTMYGIERIAKELPEESFDKILLDAPCSGEGLLNINKPKDFKYWSTAQIKRLQALQKKAINAAWQLLKPGGTLVYSTCTMASEENEAVVDYLLSRSDNARLTPLPFKLENQCPPLQSWGNKTYKSDLRHCLRLAPSENVEAFFVAKITKS